MLNKRAPPIRNSQPTITKPIEKPTGPPDKQSQLIPLASKGCLGARKNKYQDLDEADAESLFLERSKTDSSSDDVDDIVYEFDIEKENDNW